MYLFTSLFTLMLQQHKCMVNISRTFSYLLDELEEEEPEEKSSKNENSIGIEEHSVIFL